MSQIKIRARALISLAFVSALALSTLAHAQVLTTLPSKVIQPNEPPDVRLTQEFGTSVSTVWNNNSLLVGAPGTDGHGAVYEFRLTNGVEAGGQDRGARSGRWKIRLSSRSRER
jgi:hypothetical protein